MNNKDYTSEEFKEWVLRKKAEAEQKIEEFKESTKDFERTTTISFKVSQYEREVIEEKAQELFMDVSKYIRHILLELG